MSDLDGSSEANAIPRPGARAIVLDSAGHVLLIQQEWDGGKRWFCPGGSLEPGETFEDGARRELREEAGIEAPLGPWVALRRARWETGGTWYDSTERFYLVRLVEEQPPVAFTPGDDSLTRLIEARWWDLADLRDTGEAVSPLSLLVLLGPLVRGVVPAEPWEVGL
ncbi:MAG: NUDIX domain-containing protein [Chloroflexi bacterium]|nr:NUDIX domain-containing protein [Chloroflexota bacterium]MDA1241152.1 NUDIX domain-containing protein [Chloroflexota bacterium]